MGFHRIPSLRLGNQIGSIFCRFTPPQANKTEFGFVCFFVVRGFRGAMLRRAALRTKTPSG